MKKTLFLALTVCSLTLTGCQTSQTLAAQFGVCPLPTKVARKLYGTCGTCYIQTSKGYDSNPNCPYCKTTQHYNRERAAATNKNDLPLAGTPYQQHIQSIYSELY